MKSQFAIAISILILISIIIALFNLFPVSIQGWSAEPEGKKDLHLRETKPTASEAQSQAQTPEEKWAILIGVDQYEDPGIGKLKYTVKDTEDLYKTLITVSGGFKPSNVLLFTPQAEKAEHRPTRNNLIAILSSWFELADENDVVLIYFSGHGIEESGKSYILPQDARTANLSLTALEVNYIKDALRKSKAKKRILILDACHSGEGKSATTMSESLANAIADSEGMVTLASCDVNEQSFEMNEAKNGAFTYFLIEALKGNADRDGDGALWASEVNYYVWDNTRKWASRKGLKQTPKYVSAVSGEIVLSQVLKPALLTQLTQLTQTSESQPSQPVSTVSTAPIPELQKITPPEEIKPQLPLPPPSQTVQAVQAVQAVQDMILIPAGKFIMGSNSGEKDEAPQHEVYLDAYYLDKYEVTNAQYAKFLDYISKTSDHSRCHPNEPKGYDHTPLYWNDTVHNGSKLPVVGVSWYDAYAYAAWAGKRLPTEAEWEKAARGADGRKFPWGDETPYQNGKHLANYTPAPGKASDDGFRYAAPVGSFPEGSSPYGVMDMGGNVWELTADWYGAYIAGVGSDNPKGPSKGTYRVLKGGSWLNREDGLRCSYRVYVLPNTRSVNIGFRCAK